MNQAWEIWQDGRKVFFLSSPRWAEARPARGGTRALNIP